MMSLASILAKCWPKQFLGPYEKGMNASDSDPLDHLEISNSYAFSK